jgi:hypothetical protein
VSHVTDEDVAWIRDGTSVSRTIRSAIPDGYDVDGLVDLVEDGGRTESRLLTALGIAADEELVAGWIDRDGLMTEAGDEHLLYATWRYRIRIVRTAELEGRLHPDVHDDFPDLLFPRDRAWLVSTLWDDTWRSIGASEATAREIERRLPAFERIDPTTDIADTGREVR